MNRCPKVARKIQARRIMNRAWKIARNRYNTLIANASKLAEIGIQYPDAAIFFRDALVLAWREERAGRELYTMQQGLPRKVLPRIQAQLRTFMQVNDRHVMSEKEYKFKMGVVALNARFGQDKVEAGMIEEIATITGMRDQIVAANDADTSQMDWVTEAQQAQG